MGVVPSTLFFCNAFMTPTLADYGKKEDNPFIEWSWRSCLTGQDLMQIFSRCCFTGVFRSELRHELNWSSVLAVYCTSSLGSPKFVSNNIKSKHMWLACCSCWPNCQLKFTFCSLTSFQKKIIWVWRLCELLCHTVFLGHCSLCPVCSTIIRAHP